MVEQRPTHVAEARDRSWLTTAGPAALVGWRWRYEMAGTTVATVAVTRFGAVRTLVGAGLSLLVVAAVPRMWLWLSARGRCLAVPHAVYACLSGVWGGRPAPVVIWTEPQLAGERMFVWCRDGTAPTELMLWRQELAAACRCDEVEVQLHPRHRQMAIIRTFRYPRG